MSDTLPHLNLVVLRSPDIDRSVRFYRALGLLFTKHSHGTGPEHYASEGSGFVFEIYPSTAKNPSTIATRIGFRVDTVDRCVELVKAEGGEIITPPADSEWGRRAVVKDLDGHVVELIGRSEKP